MGLIEMQNRARKVEGQIKLLSNDLTAQIGAENPEAKNAEGLVTTKNAALLVTAVLCEHLRDELEFIHECIAIEIGG